MYRQEWQSNLSWVYDNFGLTDNKKLFPMTMKMELSLPDDRIRMNLSFQSVNINGALKLDYAYPIKYKQVSLQDVLKLIKSLS
jgi:hypothetical protein